MFVDTRTRLNQVTQGIAVESNMASEAVAVRQALLGGPQLAKVAKLALPGFRPSAGPEKGRPSLSGRTCARGFRSKPRREEPARRSVLDHLYRFRPANRPPCGVKELLNLFLANSLGGSQEGAEEAQQFLAGQIAEYEKKLQASESRLADFKRQNAGLVPGATGDYFSRLHSETDELDKDKLTLTMAEQKRNELQRQLSSEQPMMGGTGIAGPHGGLQTLAAQFGKPRRASMICCCAIRISTRTSLPRDAAS